MSENGFEPKPYGIPVIIAGKELWIIGKFVMTNMASIELIEGGLLGRWVAVQQKPMQRIFDNKLEHDAIGDGQKSPRGLPPYRQSKAKEPERQEPLQRSHMDQNLER